MEQLRAELHECIEEYGLNDPRTIQKSQELDKLIATEQLLRRASNG